MFLVYLVIAILLGLIPANIAGKKGKNFATWWLFGTALFIVALPMALIVAPEPAALAQQRRKEGLVKCPFCAEYIKKEAKVCRFCGRDIPVVEKGTRGKFSSGGTKPQGVAGKKTIHMPPSNRTIETAKKTIRIPAATLAAMSQGKHTTRKVAPYPATQPPADSPKTPEASSDSVLCPHCQVPIDISGLSAGKYGCPNCHGEIELT